MSTFNKEKFPLLFASVAEVLGEEDAETQLSAAWNGYIEDSESDWVDSGYISTSFKWSYTPQGDEFWRNMTHW